MRPGEAVPDSAFDFGPFTRKVMRPLTGWCIEHEVVALAVVVRLGGADLDPADFFVAAFLRVDDHICDV